MGEEKKVNVAKIIYTKHARIDKFNFFKRHKFKISQKSIKNVIENPEHVDEISDFPKIIASKSLDEKHILRVVYKKEGDIITVITFYPAEKGRYY